MRQTDSFIENTDSSIVGIRDYLDDQYVFGETEEDNGKYGYDHKLISDEEDE